MTFGKNGSICNVVTTTTRESLAQFVSIINTCQPHAVYCSRAFNSAMLSGAFICAHAWMSKRVILNLVYLCRSSWTWSL